MRSIWQGLPRALCAAAAFLLAGCDAEDDAALRLSDSSCAFPASGGRRTVTVATDRDSFAVELAGPDADRFSVEPQADRFALVAGPNAEARALEAEALVRAGNVTLRIGIAQAPAAGGLSVKPAPESWEFYSDGGTFTATVSAPGEWSAESDASWCEAAAGDALLTVTAAPNEGGQREANVTVTCGAEAVRLRFVQGTAAENPYCRLAGRWELWCDGWMYGDELSGEGTHTGCTLEVLEPWETFSVRNLFVDGTSIEAYYDPQARTLTVPLGWSVLHRYYYYYLCTVNTSTLQFGPGTLTGAVADDGLSVSFTGLEDGWGLGLVGYDGAQYVKFSDVWYAVSGNLTLKRPEDRTPDGAPKASAAEAAPKRFLPGGAPACLEDVGPSFNR